MFRWSEDTTTKFVTKYIEHDCLWNIKSPLYKNKQIKNSAYLDLENTMNISGFGEKEIKCKIKNIRSTYAQELKKIKDSKKSGAGTDTIYVPTIKWFKILDESLRNITSELTQSESNLPSEDIAQTDTDINTDADENTSASGDTDFREPEPKLKPPTKRKRLSQLTSMVSQLKEITEIASNTNSKAEDNEFEVFGKHVGLQLKAMPLLVALEAQEHIQLYLNRIRRQHLHNAQEQNRFSRLPTTFSYDSQASPSYSSNSTPNSTYYSENYSGEQPLQETPFTLQYQTSQLLSEAMTNASV